MNVCIYSVYICVWADTWNAFKRRANCLNFRFTYIIYTHIIILVEYDNPRGSTPLYILPIYTYYLYACNTRI